MTKRVKYTAICKEWKLINLHLLRPWSTCKVWISYADVSSAVCHEIYDHPNNLEIESDAFCASDLVVMGFLLWEEGSGKQDLRVVKGWGFHCHVFEREPLVLIRCYIKGDEGVENAAVAVEESSVVDVKSGTALIISSGRVLVFNCYLKARYLFCNRKYCLAFSSSRRSFRESTSSMLPCISCIAARSGTGERVQGHPRSIFGKYLFGRRFEI